MNPHDSVVNTAVVKDNSERVVDPVCGMKILPGKAVGSQEYEGRSYYFCSQSCVQKFKADPVQYAIPKSAVDPVCGMKVPLDKAAATAEYRGEKYFFCSKGCKEKFNADAAQYIAREADQRPAPLAVNGLEYICPMDPEVHQIGPGVCPKCGMALEPATIAAPVTRTEYTCPMHPQIVRQEPGNCPICGMTLEPREDNG